MMEGRKQPGAGRLVDALFFENGTPIVSKTNSIKV
jgi:hypothetical protein